MMPTPPFQKGVPKTRRAGACLAVYLGLSVIVGALSAQTLEVDPANPNCSDQSGQPYCSIQAAIDGARAGGTVHLSAGTYDLWQDSISIDKSITLKGAGRDATILDGGGHGPDAVIAIAASAGEVHVSSLSIVNRIRAGSATLGAGAIDHAGRQLTLSDVVIRGNQGGYGGGLHVHSNAENAVLTNVDISENKAIVGAGIAVRNVPLTTLTIDNGTIARNSAVFTGGGIFLREVGEVSLHNVVLDGNESGTRGGGIYVYTDSESGPLHIAGSTITGNKSSGTGGVDIKEDGTEVTLERVVLLENVSHDDPARNDCWAPSEGIFRSLGNNRIGNGDGCRFRAGQGDAVGTTESALGPE